MLEKLIIKNYLLLKNIEIDFSSGFNVITGETGAGKSILIDALSLLLGERADYSIINKNKQKMVVEGVFSLSNEGKRQINNILKQGGFENIEEMYFIIRRELYLKGYSRNFVNDSPININDLKSIGEIIVDIHSQNEHQSLLKKETHIQLLDLYLSKTQKLRFETTCEEYRTDYIKLIKEIKNYEDLIKKKTEIDNKMNFIEFQLKEIKEVNPAINEDENLEKELKISENSEIIQQALTFVYSNIYDEDRSILERIKKVEKELEKIEGFNDEVTDILKEIKESEKMFLEHSRTIKSIIDKAIFDPEKTEEIRERLYKLQFIKKKYGKDIEGILKIKTELENDLSLAANFDHKTQGFKKAIDDEKNKLFEKARLISKTRKEQSKTLEKGITEILNEIGFENAVFKVCILHNVQKHEFGDENSINLGVRNRGENILLTEKGIDVVEFMVKINKGDEFSSLRKTASGGEVSRIMLAIKSVLTEADIVGTLIFDEIDTGISGRIAQQVGKVIKKLSATHQVISITHLPQIAAMAEEHFVVEKEIDGDTTLAKIQKLNKPEKIIEVARLLSGEKVTDASIKTAKELIGS